MNSLAKIHSKQLAHPVLSIPHHNIYTYGGVNGRAIRWLTRLAHRSRECSDAAYFDRAGRVVSFFHHHACAISRAAAVGHGEVLLKVAADARNRATRVKAAALDRMIADARAGNGAPAQPAPVPAAHADDVRNMYNAPAPHAHGDDVHNMYNALAPLATGLA